MAAHTPVLVDEVLELFQPKPGDTLLDATVGQGGHASAYLGATAPNGRVRGIDADAQAVATAKERLRPFGDRVSLTVGHFAYLKDSIQGGGILNPPQFTHILFDLGIGSHQLADSTRGFSFSGGASISMKYGVIDHLPPSRLNSLNQLEERLNRLPDVAEIIANTSVEELAEILWTFGEERFRRRIATALKKKPYPQTGVELAERVAAAVPGFYRRGRIHPATRTFQALRLAVNRELESLTSAIPQAIDLLAPNGILTIISFHSLEDRIVKETFRRYKTHGEGVILTKKPIMASEGERIQNARARSAKLRGLQKSKPDS